MNENELQNDPRHPVDVLGEIWETSAELAAMCAVDPWELEENQRKFWNDRFERFVVKHLTKVRASLTEINKSLDFGFKPFDIQTNWTVLD